MNTGFIFIKWCENKYFTSGDYKPQVKHDYFHTSTAQDENKSVSIEKT